MTSTQDQAAMQLFDHAVAMSRTQPEAALSIFRQLRRGQDGPFSQAAGEQLINTLWTLRRLEDCQKEAKELMGELEGKPEQAYFLARISTRWAEIAIASGNEAEAQPVIEKAEGIFYRNGDFYNVGKVEQLKAAISTSQGQYEKAGHQAKRGQRLIAIHAPTVMPDTSRSSTPEMAGMGSGGSSN